MSHFKWCSGVFVFWNVFFSNIFLILNSFFISLCFESLCFQLHWFDYCFEYCLCTWKAPEEAESRSQTEGEMQRQWQSRPGLWTWPFLRLDLGSGFLRELSLQDTRISFHQWHSSFRREWKCEGYLVCQSMANIILFLTCDAVVALQSHVWERSYHKK